MKKRIFASAVRILFCFSALTASPVVPEGISLIKKSYPDLNIKVSYKEEIKDWELSFSNNGFDYQFFWCDGRILPEKELSNKEKYWTLLYAYAKELRDPATMTEAEKDRLKNFSSTSNRKNGAGTPMFFFDAVYESNTKESLEKHIKSVSFLGKRTRIHERIEAPLKKVEAQIVELAEKDSEVKEFINSIKSSDAYYWRLIAGTNRKSFHSLGIAVDILPVKITGEIYWSWAKDKNPDGWMLTPLSGRWLPPAKVIEIFEKEGFIFGGKWAIWDNMHFEYHPELIG